jgi:hypothetical protein
MTAEPNNPEIPKETNDSGAPDVREQQILDRIADKFSKRAVETERRFDREHDIFTK